MFLLDTDHCIYILNNTPIEVVERSRSVGKQNMAVSPFTVAELVYGACKSQHKQDNLAVIEKLCNDILVLPFEAGVVYKFGEIKASLAGLGQLITSTGHDTRAKRDFDIAIAATALVYGCTLVTHNTGHYESIDELEIVDWHPAANP